MSTETFVQVAHANLASGRGGLPAYCTAHPFVLDTVLRDASFHDGPVLIEATCNQVNQEGGYTGQKPADFIRFVESLADRAGLGRGRLILGGDHLGPNPWRRLPAGEAMSRAHVLVRDYVAAGFEKIHLDASMALGGDPDCLDVETIAARAADLCRSSEQAAGNRKPYYVIGTEVPVPGGETGGMGAIAVTRLDDLRATVESHRRAFADRGIERAFERVLAVVAQPGVDFDQVSVLPFDAANASALAAGFPELGGVVGEAHSTDYQSEEALGGLCRAHFAILKVGPELTFAYRSGILSLEALEAETVPSGERSDISRVLLNRMDAMPEHWRGYYGGVASTLRSLKLFSYSDRVRYYWPDRQVVAAVTTLTRNLERARPVEPLWRQFFPDLALPAWTVQAALAGRIGVVLARYRAASAG